MSKCLFLDFRSSNKKTRKLESTLSLPSFVDFFKNTSEYLSENLQSVVSEPIISMSSCGDEIKGQSSYKSAFDELWIGMLGNFSEPDVTLLRFLRARKWNLDESFNMFVECLHWRWKNDILSLMRIGESSIPSHLLLSGKTFFHGTDKSGHLLM